MSIFKKPSWRKLIAVLMLVITLLASFWFYTTREVSAAIVHESSRADTTSSTSGDSSVSVSGVSTSGPGRLLLATVSYNPATFTESNCVGTGHASVSGGGLTWTRITSCRESGAAVEVWYAVASTQISNQTITANLGGTRRAVIVVSAYTGVDLDDPIDATCTAGGTGTSPTCDITTTEENSLITGNLSVAGFVTASAGSGYTIPSGGSDRANSSTSGTYAVGAHESRNSVTASPSTVEVDFSISGLRSWAIVGVALKELPVPSAPTFYSDDGGSNQIDFNNIRRNTTTPIFRVSSTHAESFNRFQIELNTDSGFSGTSYTQTFTGTYTSGTAYNLLANSLSPTFSPGDNQTFFVRARASADGGSNWGDWSSGTWSFTYKNAGSRADWYQGADAQFNTGTLTDTQTSGDNSVQLEEGAPTSSPDYVSTSAEVGDCNWSSKEISASGSWSVGDGLLLWVGIDSTATITPPTGFVSLGSITSGSTKGQLFAKRYEGESDFDVSISSPSCGSAIISGFSGITPTGNFWEGTTFGNSNGTLPGITTSGPLRRLVGFATTDSIVSWSQPSGYTKFYDDFDSGGVTRELASAGSVGNTNWGSTNNTSMRFVQVALIPAGELASSGTILSPAVNYDWNISSAVRSWGRFAWNEDETNGTISMKLYYTNSTTCDTVVPDSALTGNESGFTSGPVDISGLDVNTYDELCLQATLTDSGGTPYLLDWGIFWNTTAVKIQRGVRIQRGTRIETE